MKYVRKSALLLLVLFAALCSFWNESSTSALMPTPTPIPVTEQTTPMPQGKGEPPILVNRWNPIPDDFGVSLRELENGQTVAAECYEPLLQMLSDCAAAGYDAEVCSGYRSVALQTELYENKVARVMAEGHGRRRSEQIAASEVAYPGTSEHHTGLAVDIVDADNGVLDETQAEMPAQQWLMANCHRYGFILRYPADKTEITGIIYEPWHYRYVGTEAAEIITAEGLCLEEYPEMQG